MARIEDEDVEQAAPAPVRKGKSRWWMWAVAAVVALGGLGVGGAYLFGGKPAAGATAKGGKKAGHVEKRPEFFLALEPAFVVNFRDDDSLRYLQVGVTLMSHEQGPLDTAKEADPVIRNALLMLFSRQDYAILSDVAGKQKLQAEALDTVQKIVAERTGRKGIDALYFTSFVMQ